MNNKIVFVSLLAFLSVFFLSCEKEYSCEGCGGVLITDTATYSFSGGTASCTGATLTGSYVSGTPLGTDNTVILNVVVDSVGSYSVKTETVNGMFFSAVGFFASAGAQTIVLRGSGTPTTDGIFNFTAGANGCTFSVNVLPVVDNNFTYYYEATIDGTFYKETVTSTNGYMAGYSIVGTDDVLTQSNVIPFGFPPMPAGKTGMAVTKGILFNYPTRNNTEFKTFFNLGNYSYRNPPSFTDGVSITWYDQNGTEWKTENAPADQSGSRFAIVQVDEVTVTPVYTVAITFTFDCKLYDSNGNVKTLTGGRYKGAFGKL